MDYRERINDPQETMRSVLDGRQATIWTALPGIIQSVDLNAMTCTVQPAIQGVVIDPQNKAKRIDVNLPVLLNVPIHFPRGGSYTVTFPVAANDECLLVFSSRCIDNWWQQGGVQPQYERRLHDLSDAFALVGPFSQATKISNVSGTTAQLRSNDGTQYVEVDLPNKIVRMVTGDSSVVVDGDKHLVSVNGPLEIQLNTIKLSGNVNFNGAGTAVLDLGGGTLTIQNASSINLNP